MRAVSFLTVIVFCLTVATFSAATAPETPREIAGFVLGSDLDHYKDRVDMQTTIPVMDMRYLKEVTTEYIPGYSKGTVVYATCSAPGEIVRIKMKYEDPSKLFYEKLLDAVKNKFGNPDEWRGDAFHHFIAWKWSFKNKTNDSISMILQHAVEGSLDHPDGNVIKLTNWTAVQRDRRCYEKGLEEPGQKAPKETEAAKGAPGIKNLVPK